MPHTKPMARFISTWKRLRIWRALPILVWWLIPLVGVAYVLSANYSALGFRWFANYNGQAVGWQTIGQTFLSRYPNLYGVTLKFGTGNLKSNPSPPLTLHLRQAPT